MKHVRVRLTANGEESDVHPMYGVLTGASFVERATALQWNFTGDALGIVHYVVGDIDALEAAIEDISEVQSYETARVDDHSCYLYVRDSTTRSLRELFGPVLSGGILVVPPVRYEPDGSVTFSVFGPEGAVQNAVTSVPAPVEVTVEAVGGLAGVTAALEARLTDRQYEIAKRALQMGYYDIPRTASQEDIADDLGCAPSTVAEHLRKAESRTMRAQFR